MTVTQVTCTCCAPDHRCIMESDVALARLLGSSLIVGLGALCVASYSDPCHILMYSKSAALEGVILTRSFLSRQSDQHLLWAMHGSTEREAAQLRAMQSQQKGEVMIV